MSQKDRLVRIPEPNQEAASFLNDINAFFAEAESTLFEPQRKSLDFKPEDDELLSEALNSGDNGRVQELLESARQSLDAKAADEIYRSCEVPFWHKDLESDSASINAATTSTSWQSDVPMCPPLDVPSLLELMDKLKAKLKAIDVIVLTHEQWELISSEIPWFQPTARFCDSVYPPTLDGIPIHVFKTTESLASFLFNDVMGADPPLRAMIMEEGFPEEVIPIIQRKQSENE